MYLLYVRDILLPLSILSFCGGAKLPKPKVTQQQVPPQIKLFILTPVWVRGLLIPSAANRLSSQSCLYHIIIYLHCSPPLLGSLSMQSGITPEAVDAFNVTDIPSVLG
ncbi:hypothetical protein XENTR_v10000362 [Xenopus tropicalis]|nr:hypothetical protein XENTR_v10000362 [Xenopus tropicalis]